MLRVFQSSTRGAKHDDHFNERYRYYSAVSNQRMEKQNLLEEQQSDSESVFLGLIALPLLWAMPGRASLGDLVIHAVDGRLRACMKPIFDLE